MKLVIAEKPSVGAALASALGAKERKDGYLVGNGWIVSWCVGHLLELADAGSYDERYTKWNLADLPILPDEWRFVSRGEKKKQLEAAPERQKRGWCDLRHGRRAGGRTHLSLGL